LHHGNAPQITRLCQENGASWIKLAQILSCRPDVLPRIYIEQLRTLQNDAPPVPFVALEPVLAEELGTNWRSLFQQIDPVPVATASIAQVHRAVTADGQAVAVKIQLPGVEQLFQQDFVFFRLAAEMIAPFARQLDIPQIIRKTFEMNRQELDFTNEAENLQRFSSLPHDPRIRFPNLIASLSTPRVLVTSWIEGQRLREFLDAHPDRAKELLGAVLDSYIRQIIEFGVYHADPHPGNFIIGPAGEITILDFGAIGRLSPAEAMNYGALLLELFRAGTGDLQGVFTRAGFSGLSGETIRDLSKIFLGVKGSDSDYSDMLAQAMDTLRQHRITIPDSFVSLARVLVTVGGFMQTYKVKMNVNVALMSQYAAVASRNNAQAKAAASPAGEAVKHG
jgi:ubiquinone biosynthesis protein